MGLISVLLLTKHSEQSTDDEIIAKLAQEMDTELLIVIGKW